MNEGNGGRAGSTGALLRLCGGYYLSYVLTGVLVKYFTGGIRQPRMSDMGYLFNNTIGGNALCLIAVVVLQSWLFAGRLVHGLVGGGPGDGGVRRGSADLPARRRGVLRPAGTGDEQCDCCEEEEFCVSHGTRA